MFGFIVGTLCLIALVRLLRRDSWGYRPGPWHHRGYGQRAWMRAVFERLDTTPGQEKAVMAAVGELRETMGAMRHEMASARAQVGRAVAAPTFDSDQVRAILSEQGGVIERARSGAVATLAKVHEVLDDRQRKILGEMIETGPRWAFRGGRC